MERKKVNTLDVYANERDKTAVLVVNKQHARIVPLPDTVNSRFTHLPTTAACEKFIQDSLPSLPIDYGLPFEIAWLTTGITSRDGWVINLSPF